MGKVIGAELIEVGCGMAVGSVIGADFIEVGEDARVPTAGSDLGAARTAPDSALRAGTGIDLAAGEALRILRLPPAAPGVVKLLPLEPSLVTGSLMLPAVAYWAAAGMIGEDRNWGEELRTRLPAVALLPVVINGEAAATAGTDLVTLGPYPSMCGTTAAERPTQSR